MMTCSYGCSRETMDRIAKALDMTSDELAMSGLDMDVLDTARALVEQGITVADLKGLEWWAPGFLDAVAIAASNLQFD